MIYVPSSHTDCFYALVRIKQPLRCTLQYLATGSTLTAVGLFQLPAPQSGTLPQISSGTRPSVQTVLHVCLKRTCSLDTSAFSALEVLDDNRAL